MKGTQFNFTLIDGKESLTLFPFRAISLRWHTIVQQVRSKKSQVSLNFYHIEIVDNALSHFPSATSLTLTLTNK